MGPSEALRAPETGRVQESPPPKQKKTKSVFVRWLGRVFSCHSHRQEDSQVHEAAQRRFSSVDTSINGFLLVKEEGNELAAAWPKADAAAAAAGSAATTPTVATAERKPDVTPAWKAHVMAISEGRTPSTIKLEMHGHLTRWRELNGTLKTAVGDEAARIQAQMRECQTELTKLSKEIGTVKATLRKPSHVGTSARVRSAVFTAEGSFLAREGAASREERFTLEVDGKRAAKKTPKAIPLTDFHAVPALLEMGIDKESATFLSTQLYALLLEYPAGGAISKEELQRAFRTLVLDKEIEESYKLVKPGEYSSSVEKEVDEMVSEFSKRVTIGGVVAPQDVVGSFETQLREQGLDTSRLSDEEKKTLQDIKDKGVSAEFVVTKPRLNEETAEQIDDIFELLLEHETTQEALKILGLSIR